ncbi:MAG: TetR/AcrR family transcriptional regulator [Betaproteobacteria bacterium]
MPDRSTPRERLLAAADDLFYADGIHTVGIDRVIERAGVAKASLYSTFGSKDELVRAYLLGRHERRRRRLTERLAGYDSARDKLLGIFDYLGESYRQPTFRGCPFVNANAESQPGGPAQEVADLSRAWVRSLVRGLVEELGVAQPDPLTEQLVLLYDGATVSARLDRNPGAAQTARAAAEALLDAATATRTEAVA